MTLSLSRPASHRDRFARPAHRAGTAALALAALALAALALCSCSRAPDRAASAASATPRIIAADAQRILDEARRPGASATVVNVWASWCQPCVAEMPDLLRLERDYRAKGVRVILVSADFDSAAPAAFLAERGVDFDTYLKSGDDMTFVNTLDRRWSGALPATFVFDGSGAPSAFWEGRADFAKFENAVHAAMPSNRR
jgi:thiol-disulfide isomerase/thioredoxin